MPSNQIKTNGYTIDTYKYQDGRLEVSAYADTEEILSNCFTRMEDLEELLSKRVGDMYEEQEVAAALAELVGRKVGPSDNSYNWSSDLSQDINFTIVSTDDDWCNSSEDQYIVLRVHQGGDVRGNYSDCRVYKFDSEGAYSFLDSSHCGVRLDGDDCDEYTTSYRSEPQYQFSQDFKMYGVRPDGTILCKRLSDGKRFKAYFENRGLDGW